MPKFEVEIDDKGEFVGSLPAEIDALFKRTETSSYGTGLKKGREDALTEAEQRIKAEREKWEKEHPQQVTRLKELEEESTRLRENEIKLNRTFSEQARIREENHAKAMADASEAISKHRAKLSEMLKSQIRMEAISAGARDESLSELEIILGAYVGLDPDSLDIYVKGEDGKALMKQGKPVPPGDFIREYLGAHPHHRKPAGGTGGGARGGANYSGHGRTVSESAARERIEHGDRSSTAINDFFEATRKQRSA